MALNIEARGTHCGIVQQHDRDTFPLTVVPWVGFYFEGSCDDKTRIKIYCYIAVCGLLWSNWCEYKRKLGVEFGEYSLRQYRYAKDYYKIVQQELGEEGKETCTK